ncbi:hypothetical protein B0H67DRAFT_69886 [Lasiosphaeris hirsuta]|uniref:Uncharacterized protein n=1 Tax=Lasiosphaeris hirsuta TaxID=260670 RepID=A0AA40BBQ8_9PEZI|nr:hypothetical protein B0H67DRAFT_69886 [Lasiosphaeris hirsuta]
MPTLAACGNCSPITVSRSCNQTARTCTYSTASGNTIETSMDSTGHSSFSVVPSNGTLHPIASTTRAYFSVFDMLSLIHPDGEDLNIAGAECALWFCIQALSLNTTEGTQSETVMANWSTTALKQGGSGAHGAEYVFVNIPSSQLNVDNGTRYAVTHEAITALRGFMTAITSGTVHADASALDYTSDWVEAMWNATTGGMDSLDRWIATFAASMTTEIRRSGNPSSSNAGSGKRYDGSAMQLAPFIRVQWYWLAYPAFMIVLSVYFLLHTIIASARDGVSVWKSGALPMLFCRIDDNIHDHVGDGMDVPDGLEERVGDVCVAMYRGENGQWGFRTTSGDGD